MRLSSKALCSNLCPPKMDLPSYRVLARLMSWSKSWRTSKAVASRSEPVMVPVAPCSARPLSLVRMALACSMVSSARFSQPLAVSMLARY